MGVLQQVTERLIIKLVRKTYQGAAEGVIFLTSLMISLSVTC